MNKWEEALMEVVDTFHSANVDGRFITRSNLDLLKELVKRATPMKPSIINYFMGTNRGFCVCGNVVTSAHNFCNYCGQYLDWSDVK